MEPIKGLQDPENDDDSFVWTVGPELCNKTNTEWKNISTTTQYDHYSMPLEVKDINDNYAATKMCDNNSKVLAVSNAQYTEMFYSGAEYISSNPSYFDGQVKNDNRTAAFAHTGKYSSMAAAGEEIFEVDLHANQHRAGKYKISVWAHKNNYLNARVRINGEKPFNGEKVFAGDWVQLNHYEDVGSGASGIYLTSASGNVYYDDFRMHPVASSMTSYVYNEWDELWYIIGNNGLATKFEYDAAGRLIKTYTEVVDDGAITGGFKKVSENSYNYKAQ